MLVKQITILGLGQIGASIGLALAGKGQFVRVGHDSEPGQARRAEKMGAVDKASGNLYRAVEKADVIVLAMPLDQVRVTLALIARDLKPGVVIMDTAPVKAAVEEWIRQVLPQGCSYIGLTPVVNPLYLLERQRGIDAARPDLFHKGVFAIVTPFYVPPDALNLATEFASWLGAEHMFTDVVEIDGLMAAVHILPQLLSAALLQATIGEPGWKEGRKLAGRSYAQVAEPMISADDPTALAYATVFNAENIHRLLGAMITILEDWRDDLAEGDHTLLEERFTRLRDDYLHWLQDRGAANWAARELSPSQGMPSSTEWLGRLIGIRPRKRNKPD